MFKAAAAAGTDYLDLCGEPEFIERMELECAAAAKASGALMACASAFDSVSGCSVFVWAGLAVCTLLPPHACLAPCNRSCRPMFLAMRDNV